MKRLDWIVMGVLILVFAAGLTLMVAPALGAVI